MNTSDNERRLDEYIDAIIAGRPVPALTRDDYLADLIATARNLRRSHASVANPIAANDVPSRLAAALERELRADQTRATRRIESNDMRPFNSTSSNGTLRPPDDTSAPYAIPHRPECRRQLLQFTIAIAAFLIVGIVLAQIIGSRGDGDPGNAVGSHPGGTPTSQVAAPIDQATQTPSPDLTEAASLGVTPTAPDPTSTASTAVVDPTEDAVENVEPTATPKPDAPSAASLNLSSDYATCDDTVVAYGTNFEPGTTITIFGGGLLGDVFGPVVDEHPVDENGEFEVALDLLRLDGCGGGNPAVEGTLDRIAAATGSSLDGIDTEGPSASAVLRYSQNVPGVVRNREPFQSCGVETLLNRTQLRDETLPDQEARACFIEALTDSGVKAEFVSHQQTTDGFIVTSIYRTSGDGSVVVFHDNSRDPVKSTGWTTSTCTGATLGAAPWYEITLEGCSQDVQLE